MEIFIEEPLPVAPPRPLPLIPNPPPPNVRAPQPIPPGIVVSPSAPLVDVALCPIMTWDSSLSPEFVEARWPGKKIKFIRAGRAFAPITEIPIAQIPYLIVAAKYFTGHVITHALQPFLTRQLTVALRDIDWLMVNYSKQFDSCYFLERDALSAARNFMPRGELVSVYEMYNNTLHMYRRRHFRTYKQSHRMYMWAKDSFEETTIGQLLCLMWAIEWGVVSFAFARCNDIKHHETFVSKQNQADIDRFRQLGQKRKRMELVARPETDVWCVEIPHDSLSLGSLRM